MQSNRLAELRHAADLSQYQLAVRLDVTPSTVWRWEHGRGGIPDKQKLALAAQFGVSVGDLMGWPSEAAA